jgi:hypothetical protein
MIAWKLHSAGPLEGRCGRRLLMVALLIVAFCTPLDVAAQATAVVTLAERALLAIKPLLRASKAAIGDADIVRLANRSAQPGGSVAVGRELGSRQFGRAVLEDAYLRMAVHQKRIERAEAESMFARLSGTPGFQETLRKVTGANPMMTTGHRNELRIALAVRQQGIKVLAIGQRFDDGLKKGTTDIDLVLDNGRRAAAIEANDYAPTEALRLDQFRADMATLNAFVKTRPGRRTLPVFTITHIPLDPDAWRSLQIAARQHSVELVTGSPVEQAIQIRQLLEVAK